MFSLTDVNSSGLKLQVFGCCNKNLSQHSSYIAKMLQYIINRPVFYFSKHYWSQDVRNCPFLFKPNDTKHMGIKELWSGLPQFQTTFTVPFWSKATALRTNVLDIQRCILNVLSSLGLHLIKYLLLRKTIQSHRQSDELIWDQMDE